MKSIKILASALAIAALVLTGCVKNTINEVGIDNSKPGVTDLTYGPFEHASDAITLSWTADASLAAGATSFSAQLSETIDGKGVDMYDASKGVTVKATEATTYEVTLKGQVVGKKYYVRVRANYPRSKYSPWTYICNEAGEPMIYKVGRGIIPDAPEEPYLYKVTPTSTGIITKWDNIEGAAQFHIEFKKTADTEWTDSVAAAGITVLKIKGLPSNTEYQVRACTEFTDGTRSVYTDTFTVKTRQPGSFPKQMTNAKEFLDWIEGGVVEVEASETYELMADVDLEGQTFAAMDESFLGTFNGNGHTIKGVSSPLFYHNEGTLKDFKVQMNDQTVTTNNYAALVPENLGTISGVELKAKISCPNAPDGELHIAGITITNRGTIENTTFDGSISVSRSAFTAAPIIGGITALNLDGGIIDGANNKASITLSASETFSGFALAGIVGFLDGQVINSTNDGALSASASYAKGKCTVYKIGSGLPGIGGIVAYSVPGSTDKKFLIKDCVNNGAITYGISAMDKYTSSFNRNQFGGIVANPNGEVNGCVNNGKVAISVKTSTGSAHSAEHIVCVGGIGGGDYFAGNDGAGASATQDVTSYINCTNNGEIAIDTDANSSNSAVGGICGWPGAEGARDNKTSGCVNNGKLTLNGCGKVRMGGIHGGIGNIENSINNGAVVIEGADAASCIGGISGFMSQALYIKNCESYGTVKSNIISTQGVGGLVGNQGNAKSVVTACTVRCKVVNGDVDNTGMLVGYWNGTSNKCTYGSEAEPIAVTGKISIGGVVTKLNSGNYASFLQGSRNASGHEINTVFDTTPYVDPDEGSEEEPVISKLETPKNVVIEMLYNSAVISWDAVPNAEYYSIEYKIAGTEDPWTVVSFIEKTEYILDGVLEHGKTYAFRVKAFSTNASDYSEETSKETYEEVVFEKPVLDPATFIVEAKQVTVKWTGVVKATGYTVAYSTDGSQWTENAVEGAAVEEYTVTGLAPLTEYHIKLKVNGEGGNASEWSDAVSVTTTGAAYEYPLSIATATELNNWLMMGAMNATATDVVTLTADIDFDGITCESADSFAGIFNGNGKTIKNWKINGLPMFKVMSGTVKDFTLDNTCAVTTAAAGTFGVVVGENSGAIENVVCSAVVTTPTEVTAAMNIGAIVGLSTGTVKGCTNNSSIKFDLTANTGGHCIGGVVGRYDTAAGVIAVENCSNTGEIQYKVTGTPKNDFIGGVVGSSNHHGRANVVHNGTIKGCTNSGKVSRVWTLSASGSYLNIGGVAGYTEGDMIDCTNTGEVSTISPDDQAASSTRPAIGGVAGYVGYTATNCINKGAVIAKGVYAAGTEGNDGALGCHQPLFGGVFGGAGIAYQDVTTAGEINDCHNEGSLSFIVEQKVNGATQARLGGVVGYTSVPVKNCTNTGTVEFKPGHKIAYMAGIAGYATMDIESCTNSGKLEYDGRCATLVPVDANASYQAYIAGIVSYAGGPGFTIKNCQNTAQISFTGVETTKALSYCGGIMSTYNNGMTMIDCTNSGALSIDAACAMCIGGIAGAFNGTMTGCTFSEAASLAVTKVIGNTGKEPEIGGIAGYSNATYNSNKALGSINVSNVGESYIGGISGGMGAADKVWDGNQINTPITSSVDTKASVLGRFRSAGTNVINFINGVFGEHVSALELCANLNGNTLTTEAPATE